MTEAHCEWGPNGIRLNAIAPGPIPTDYAWQVLNPTERSGVGATQADQVPMGRTGTVEELSNLTMFLLSDACDYLTGETIADVPHCWLATRSADGGTNARAVKSPAGAPGDDEWTRRFLGSVAAS